MLDWSAAFDRQCPNIGIRRFLECGVRPEIVPVIASYLSNRSMAVKLNGVTSDTFQMPGGGPQGTLFGVIEYLIQSNNNADCVDPDLRFKYVDDLTFLELISLALSCTGLANYNCKTHVPNDIGIDTLFLPASNLMTQSHINTISSWTAENKMLLNEKKSNYMVLSRSKCEVNTRLSINSNNLERVYHVKLLGVWISDTLDWALNTKEILKKAYSRISLITKLKYAGTSVEDLTLIYTIFIRCVLEYCCVVWHSSLTMAQNNSIERVQKVCLKIILGDKYHEYNTALSICGLETLENRRENLCLKFGVKCSKSEKHKHLFPKNKKLEVQLRRREEYVVHHASTERYRSSTIPYIQRLMNRNC